MGHDDSHENRKEIPDVQRRAMTNEWVKTSKYGLSMLCGHKILTVDEEMGNQLERK